MKFDINGFLNVKDLNGVPVIIDPVPMDSKEFLTVKATNKKYIVIHNAGNPRANDTDNNNFMKVDDYLLWHFTVDEDSITQGHSILLSGFHAGDGINGKGNQYGIGIEICDDGDVAQACENAFALMQALEEDSMFYSLEVQPHKYFSGKQCPKWILDNWTWQGFMDRYHVYKRSVPKKHWAEESYQVLADYGVIIHDRRFDEPMTRGEVIALCAKMLKALLDLLK